MPNETSIPIGIDKENIVTVPKEKMKSMKTVQNICPKERDDSDWDKEGQTNDGTNLYSSTPNIMMVPIGTINSCPCLKKLWYKLG